MFMQNRLRMRMGRRGANQGKGKGRGFGFGFCQRGTRFYDEKEELNEIAKNLEQELKFVKSKIELLNEAEQPK